MKYLFTILALVLGTDVLSSVTLAACPAQAPVLPKEPAVEVASGQELAAAVRAGVRHIVVLPGKYRVPRRGIVVDADNVTIRGKTGDRDDVWITGGGPQGTATHIFSVTGSDFTARDMTLGSVKHHVIQIKGERDADRPHLHNLRFINAGQQLLKVSGAYTKHRSDDGKVTNSLFEFTDGVAYQSYTGGVDAHSTSGWIVRDNTFRNIRSPEEGLAEHAIHFWSNAVNTVVERNIIINADRGIGFGLGDRGHEGGVIKNNFVHVTRDVGIGLESSPNTYVAHNTVVTSGYPNAIEYRFPTTKNVSIVHNLANARIYSRGGGSADLIGNIDYAQWNWFEDAEAGDLHLRLGVPVVKGKAQARSDIQVDIDCDARDQNQPVDIGADQSALAIDAAIKVETPNRVARDAAALVAQTTRQISSISNKFLSDKRLLAVGLICLFGGAVVLMLACSMLLELRRIRRAIERQGRLDGE